MTCQHRRTIRAIPSPRYPYTRVCLDCGAKLGHIRYLRGAKR